MRKAKGTDLKTHVLKQILESAQNQVWTASDFAALGARAALDKVLQRLVATRELRRIDRGLYDRPTRNELTGKATVPDYRAVFRFWSPGNVRPDDDSGRKPLLVETINSFHPGRRHRPNFPAWGMASISHLLRVLGWKPFTNTSMANSIKTS
jgi:hypothetical protein